MGINLEDYVDVPERLVEFRAKHPDGSLQSEVVRWPDETFPFVVVKAWAYRTPDDPRPGIGLAGEPVPGRTPYTKDSEIQNAETSAWGRALIAVGAADAKRGIASATEVRNRSAVQPAGPGAAGRRSSLAPGVSHEQAAPGIASTGDPSSPSSDTGQPSPVDTTSGGVDQGSLAYGEGAATTIPPDHFDETAKRDQLWALLVSAAGSEVKALAYGNRANGTKHKRAVMPGPVDVAWLDAALTEFEGAA